MADAVRRPPAIREAADRLERAAEESEERSWRRNLLISLALTARRVADRIEERPEDEVIEPRQGPEPERENHLWSEHRQGD